MNFAAVTDGESLAAELDKIDGIHVVYTFWDAGRLEITSDTVGPAVFSDVTLTRPTSVVGYDFVDDVLTGFAEGTLILGLGGNDHLTGQDADDRLEGGEGNDTLVGNGGPDELLGGNGDDTLFGAAGDTLDGGNDDDLIIIDSIPASISGGDGEDTLRLMAGMAAPQVADIERIEVGADGDHGGLFRLDRPGARVDHGERRRDRHRQRVRRHRHERSRQRYFDGGGGTDTLVLTGTRAQYRVEQLGHGDIQLLDLRVGLPDGMDTVRQVERFVFADATFDASTVLNDPPTGGVTILGQRDRGSDPHRRSVCARGSGRSRRAALPLAARCGRRLRRCRRRCGKLRAWRRRRRRDRPGDRQLHRSQRCARASDRGQRSRRQRQRRAGDHREWRRQQCRDHDPGEHCFRRQPDGGGYRRSGARLVDRRRRGRGLVPDRRHDGVLSFVTAPDFEHPADSDHDNSYAVTVRAFDGSAFDDQALTIAVMDVSDAPPVTALTGTPGDDSFAAPSGAGQIDAGAGRDTVTFDFAFADATISFADDAVIVDHGTSHTVLTGVETYVFTDGTVNRDDGNTLVDDLFYYARYHDVWDAHVDADDHYAAFGAGEGRAPNAPPPRRS